MPKDSPNQPWETRIREAAEHVETDLKRVVAYINDEVVPEVRRSGSAALKTAAAELQRLAEHVDTANQRPPSDRP